MPIIGSPNSIQTLLKTVNRDGLPARDLRIPTTYWNTESKRFQGNPAFSSNVGAQNLDYRMVTVAESPFDACRLILMSAEPTNPVTGITASITPTASLTSLATPTGTKVIFTWSAAGSVDLPTGTTTAYAFIASDWMTVKSLDRTDNPVLNLPAFFLNVHLPVGGGSQKYTRDVTTTTSFSSNTAFDTAALTGNRQVLRFAQTNIDSVTTPANFTSTTDGNSFPSCIIQFRTRGKVLSYMAIGDSIAAGARTISCALGYAQLQMQLLSTPEFPVDQVNMGWSGMTSTNYLANGKAAISQCFPQVASYCVQSNNDGTAQSNFDTQMQQAMDFVQHCRNNSVLPVLVTGTPNGNDTLAISNRKIAQNNTLFNMRKSGMIVVDMYNPFANFTTVSAAGGYTWRAGLADGDDVHPNDTGAAQMASQMAAQALVPIIIANS